MRDESWVVLKFGGTSVSSLSAWQNISKICDARISEGHRVIVVCSAISQVSNQLSALVDRCSERLEFRDELTQVIERHCQLCTELDLKAEQYIAAEIRELERLTTGIALIGHAAPAVRANVLALGELMLTKIGAAWLSQSGQISTWIDARELLESLPISTASPAGHYLAAQLKLDPPDRFHNVIQSAEGVLLTQGFIAQANQKETVLLGRGGSDTSATTIGAYLGAQRTEIWTDVPGMFTSNPEMVPSARLITSLDYKEAQELASSGAKVLHPRCIEPLRKKGIPLQIRWTKDPSSPGTLISDAHPDDGSGVKAVLVRSGVVVVTMEASRMWQEVGFLATIFDVFRRHHLSVDHLATSQACVTVTLDKSRADIDDMALEALMCELSDYCSATVYFKCSAVSLIGRSIRSVLPTLGPAMSTFGERRVFLVSQAATDLSFTVVIKDEDVHRLVNQLHHQFFGTERQDSTFGATWTQLTNRSAARQAPPSPPWWQEKAKPLLDLAKTTPCYVYDLETIAARAATLQQVQAISRVNYAVKANSHPKIIKELAASGLSFDCVSAAEIRHVLECCPELSPERIIFTPNFAPVTEYLEAFDTGTHVTVDNLDLLARHGEMIANKEILLRLDPGEGQGHHEHVRTAGPKSKFGIAREQLPEVKASCRKHNIKVIGLHAHVGSGVDKPSVWVDVGTILAQIAEDWPDVRIIDVGGGLPVPEKSTDRCFDMEGLNHKMDNLRLAYPSYEIWIEPGRYLVAEAGVLLAKVTQTKSKGKKFFVGLETGMNSLIRPALYGAHHQISNLSRLGAANELRADIVGPICESADVLGHDRALPSTTEGDVFCVATTGAYGACMASNYNHRKPAVEFVLPPRKGA